MRGLVFVGLVGALFGSARGSDAQAQIPVANAPPRADTPQPVSPRPGPQACFLSDDEPRVREWATRIDGICAAAAAQVEEKLGVDRPAPGRVRCTVATRESRRLPYNDWRDATTSTLADGSVEVFFAAEALAARAAETEVVATHEMTHAVMRVRMGEAYNAVDPWYREGVALWLAGQGEDRVDLAIARASFAARGERPDPEALADGLQGEIGDAFGADDYAENYLALHWLQTVAGRDSVADSVNRVLDGTAPLVAIAEVSGVPVERVAARMQSHARRFLSARLRALSASSLTRCGRLLDGGVEDLAAACFERFVVRHPGGSLEPVARLLGAVARQRDRRGAAARRLLQPIVATGGPFADEAAHRLAASLDADGRPEAALGWACDSLRSGYTRHTPQLAFVAGRSLLRLDEPAAAAPWLERVARRYSTSPYADLARRLLVEASQRLAGVPTGPPDQPEATRDRPGPVPAPP